MILRSLILSLFILVAKQAEAQLVVQLSYQNIVYLGVDNPIDYAVKNVDTSLIELRPSFGTLTKSEDGRLIWRYCTAQPRKLMLTAYNKKTKKAIDSIGIRAKL